MPEQFFNAFVGSSSGVLKGIRAVEKCDLVVKNLDSLKCATNKNPVTSMSWSSAAEDEILIGYGSQLVKIYNLNTGSFTFAEERKIGEGCIVGIAKSKGLLMTGVESGVVKCWEDEGRESAGGGMVIDTGGPLERMRYSSQHDVLATGGKENDLKLWDVATGKQTFTAKNVRHDSLELRVPIWVTDITFLQGSKKVAVTTKYGHVRLYDPSTCTRRPVVSVQIPEQALTCISCSSKDHHVIVGSGTGQMNLVDLRSKGLVMNKYKGFVGGIKAIGCSADEPYIASVSLDRHFRIHHLFTKELLFKEYMQSKLTCLLVRSDFDLTQKGGPDSDIEEAEEGKVAGRGSDHHLGGTTNEASDQDSEEDFEDIFQSMPVVGEKRPKPTSNNNVAKKKHKS